MIVEPGVTKVALNSGCSGTNNVSNDADKLIWNGPPISTYYKIAGDCYNFEISVDVNFNSFTTTPYPHLVYPDTSFAFHGLGSAYGQLMGKIGLYINTAVDCSLSLLFVHFVIRYISL